MDKIKLDTELINFLQEDLTLPIEEKNHDKWPMFIDKENYLKWKKMGYGIGAIMGPPIYGWYFHQWMERLQVGCHLSPYHELIKPPLIKYEIIEILTKKRILIDLIILILEFY